MVRTPRPRQQASLSETFARLLPARKYTNAALSSTPTIGLRSYVHRAEKTNHSSHATTKTTSQRPTNHEVHGTASFASVVQIRAVTIFFKALLLPAGQNAYCKRIEHLADSGNWHAHRGPETHDYHYRHPKIYPQEITRIAELRCPRYGCSPMEPRRSHCNK